MSGILNTLLRPRTHSIDERDVAKIYGDDAPFMTDTNAAVLIGASRLRSGSSRQGSAPAISS